MGVFAALLGGCAAFDQAFPKGLMGGSGVFTRSGGGAAAASTDARPANPSANPAAGATTVSTTASTTTPTAAASSPAQWSTPLPHQGNAAQLNNWWAQWDDALLPELVAAAQAVSPTLAQSQARIVQARATLVAAGAQLLPAAQLDANAQRARTLQAGVPGQRTSQSTSLNVQAQAAWEIDLFGGAARTREAAAARLQAAQSQWHEARVAVAAETAATYVQLRFCQVQARVLKQDLASRRESARLIGLAANAGFQAPANAALASASASDAAQRLTGQEADCRNLAHALAALTGIEPVSLAQRLGAGEAAAKLPQPKALAVNQVPAQLLAQRPDIAAAERDVAAASADIGAAEAARYPKLSLTGSIGPAALRLVGGSVSAITWAIAPALSVPLFDGGRINANIEAAKANYAAQEIVYRAKVRGAVREVEEALTRIEAAAAREGEADVAAKGFVASFNAAQARFNAGLGSLIELEDARRTLLAADLGLQGIRRERVDAWLALYRAMGGGWQELATPTQPTQ